MPFSYNKIIKSPFGEGKQLINFENVDNEYNLLI